MGHNCYIVGTSGGRPTGTTASEGYPIDTSGGRPTGIRKLSDLNLPRVGYHPNLVGVFLCKWKFSAIIFGPFYVFLKKIQVPVREEEAEITLRTQLAVLSRALHSALKI